MRRREFVLAVAAAMLTPHAVGAGASRRRLGADEVRRYVIGKVLKTSYGTWQFKSDGTFTFKGPSNANGKYTIDGSGKIHSPKNEYIFWEEAGQILISNKYGNFFRTGVYV